MAKNRLIKSTRGNGFGILDEETNMVTPISIESNQLIESKKGNGFGIKFGDSVVPVDISGLASSDLSLFQKKNPDQSGMGLSGAGSSTAGTQEDDAWYDYLYSAVKGTAKDLIDLVPTVGRGLARIGSSGYSSGVGAPSMNIMAETRGEKVKQKTPLEMATGAEEVVNQILPYEKAKLAKGTSSVSEIFSKGSLTAGDVENVSYQLTDGLVQFAVGAIPVLGSTLLYAKNFEQRYADTRAAGIPADRAYIESGAGAAIETAIEKGNGVDKLIARGLSKEVSKEAIKDISGALLSREAFEAAAKKYAKALSWENVKTGFFKGFVPEAIEEFVQTYVDATEQDLFDYYERAKKEKNPNAKLNLYDPKDEQGLFSTVNPETGESEFSFSPKSKTLFGALDAAFYGGITGQMGGMFVNSRSFNPSIYSTLQNAYDSQGKEGLAESVEKVKAGITKASESGKLDANSYNNAIKNVDSIANNVAKFEQNSDVNSYSRYVLYDHTERIIPETANRIARTLAEATTPLELPTQDQIDNDIKNNDVSVVPFQNENQVPVPYKPYIKTVTDEQGNNTIEASIPNSVVKAYSANQMAIQEAMNNPLFAIDSLTNNNNLVTIEDLQRIGQQGGVQGDLASKLNFNIIFEANKPIIDKNLRVINYAKTVANNIANGQKVEATDLRRGYINIAAFNTGDTVFYNNKSAKILEISPDGQMLKLSGVQNMVSANDNDILLRDAVTEQAINPETRQEEKEKRSQTESKLGTQFDEWNAFASQNPVAFATEARLFFGDNKSELTEAQAEEAENLIASQLEKGAKASDIVKNLKDLGYSTQDNIDAENSFSNYLRARESGNTQATYVGIHKPAAQQQKQAPAQKAPLAEEEQITGRTIREAVGELIPFTYKGETGELYTQSNGVVTFESPKRIVEFGNIKDIGDQSIDEYDLIPQEMSIGDNYSVTIDGKTFTNKNQNPFKAITYDENGDAVSVKLQDEKGKTKVIKGARAVLIDAKYKVKKLYDESTRDQLAAAAEDAANQAAAIEDTRGEPTEAPTPRESKPTEQAPTVAERESQERIKQIAKRLAEAESEQATKNRESVANLVSSLFSSGIQVEVLNSEQIRIKYKKDVPQGMFISSNGTIVINESVLESEWGKTIIFHEGTHPIINIIRNTEPKLYRQLVDAIKEEAKTNPEVNNILAQIKSNPIYKEEFTQNDELLVEAIARVASGKLNLNEVKPTLRQAIVNFINKIGKMMGFKQVLKDSNQVALTKLANQISEVLNAGRDISEIVGSKNVTSYESDISTIQNRYLDESKIQPVSVSEQGHELSFVKQEDLIDIVSLINEISEKKQKVWFWVADQLGRGYYFDEQVGENHFLDAGISFALDPENKKNNVIWASGVKDKKLQQYINSSDYIFIISGSPERSKLFNKRVFDLLINRNKDFAKFKSDILAVSKIKDINDILNSFESWEQLRDSPLRKDLLVAFKAQESKNTELKKVLESKGAILNLESIRDGFLKDNNFNLNDIMLVLKPTGIGGKSNHSTYETNILGEVIGVPNKKINAFEILPDEVRGENPEQLGESQRSQKIAPYGVGIKSVEGIQMSDIDRSQISINTPEFRDLESESRLGFETGGIKYVSVDVLGNLQDVRGAKEGGNRTYQTESARKNIDNIKKSLQEKGWTGDSVIVDIDADGYAFIDEGNHRLIAAKELGMKEIPVKVEFGLAREGISRYNNNDIVKNPTQIISKEEIDKLKNIAKNRDYHIKYASIYLTDLGKGKTQYSDINREYNAESTVAEAGMTMAEREAWRNKNKVSQKQKRVPVVMQASRDLFNGDINFDQYVNIVRDNMPIMPFTNVPKLPSLKEIISSLNEDKLASGGIVGVNKTFADGERVASRLDIPAYENYDTWVVSIHDSAKERILGYGQTAVLKNVQFKTSVKGGLQIATNATFLNDMDKESKGKATIARIHGDWVNESPEAAHKRATELMNDPQWVQVGMNPFRHSFFYDKSTGEALTSAEEVIQVGALVLAKNPVRAPFGSQAFVDNFSYVNKLGEPIQFSDLSRDDKRIQLIRREFSTYPKGEIVQALMGAPFNLSQEKAEDLVARAFADPLAPSLPTGNPDTAIPEGSNVNQRSRTVEEYNSGYNKYKKMLLENTVGRWKKLMNDIALEYDSKFFARRKLGLATSGESLAQAQLRNLNGIAYSASQDLAVLYENIFGNGLSEEGISNLDAMIFNLRILQVDRNTERKRQDEVERLTVEFIEKNNRLPRGSESAGILAEATRNVPVKAHGLTRNGEPATSQTAQQFLDDLRNELGENGYNMLKTRADLFKKAGNDLVQKLRKAGIISNEVAESYKDDFYAFRMTLDRLYGKEDTSIFMMNGVPAIKGWTALSKTGTENYINQDARLMLAQSYIGTARAIAKNAFRESVFNENIKTDENGNQQSVLDINGKQITFVKPANYIRDADGNIRSNGKELSVREADEGYVNVPFKKDGVVNYYQMEKETFNQLEGNNIVWKDAELSGGIANTYYSVTDFANRALTGFATRNNPFFWIGNVPMDLQQQIFFTDIWTQGSLAQSNIYVSGARALARTIMFSDFFGRNKEYVDKTLEEYIAAGGAMDRLSTMKEQRQRTIEMELSPEASGSKIKQIMRKGKKGLKAGLSYMNEKTEIAMRLAAYDQSKKNLIKKFEEENNGAKPNEAQMKKIQEIAAAKSRAYTDFAQRGVSLPNLNVAYLNSSIQAAGAAAEYIYDNPKEAASKVTQLAIGKFVSTIALMALMGDAYDELDEYRKDMYSFLFSWDTGKKDEKGNPIYVTADIRNNPSLTPALTVSRVLAERTMKALQGKEQEDITVLGTAESFVEKLNQALPIPIPNVFSLEGLKKSGLQLITKHALTNGLVKAFMGYDAFRNREIVSKRDEELSPYMQGMDDPDVAYFYKTMAKSMSGFSSAGQISPAKMQSVAETFITSPKTNGLVGLMYMTLSDVANAIIPAKTENERGQYSWSDVSKIAKSLTGRFATFTDAEKAEFRKNEQLYIMSREESMRYNDSERIIDNQLKDLYKKDPANFFTNVDKMAKEEGYWDDDLLMSRIDKKAENLDNGNYDKTFIKDDILNEVKILHYTKGIEGKAKLLKYMFDNDSKKATEVIDGMINYGTPANEAYDTEDLYLQMIKKK